MFNGFISRQPIFDLDFTVWAYDLQACSPDYNQSEFKGFDTALLQGASENMGIEELTGQTPGMIPITREILASSELPWPAEQLILNISGHYLCSRSDLSALEKLQLAGYTLAISEPMGQIDALLDFGSNCLLIYNADDLPSAESIARIKQRGSKVLARNIQTPEAYQKARELGCDLFHGCWFEAPYLFSDTKIPAERMDIMHLLARLQDPDVEIDEVETLVTRNAAISFKLLKLLNSAFFAIPNTVDSIGRGVVFFGLERLKNWATVIAMNAIDYQPRELLTVALVRARTCQLLAQTSGHADAEQCYIAGLFSTLDAMMNVPMETILDGLHLVKDIEIALLSGEGPVGEVLKSARALESGDCHHALSPLLEQGVGIKAYLNAISVAHEVQSEIA